MDCDDVETGLEEKERVERKHIHTVNVDCVEEGAVETKTIIERDQMTDDIGEETSRQITYVEASVKTVREFGDSDKEEAMDIMMGEVWT